ncbi:Fascin-like incomplete domain containing protein [Pandoravirus quercus]|uniref:Fascin-like incomplete domain containing protein n=1 Tax=Pandoravirus quercus TaxID=2107709 RepID=A0A2U7UA86_9VIRU|nr:Fascin-like incomplete domain containing protein [Pandoravirus quercus]AVK75290.1 Fascin-like incomplete domain containing protein [Pandoravirus quercus]
MQRAMTIKSDRRPSIGAVLVTAVALAALCLVAVPPAASLYHYTVFVPTSRTWSAPASATNVTVTLWGGGGASAVNIRCGAGGGSGAAIIGRSTGSDAWTMPIQEVQWAITVGQGGAPRDAGAYDPIYSGGTAGDGGATTVVATGPDSTELFRATAYGGGGAKVTDPDEPRACQGGGGGGQGSSAVGPVPGGGTPMGGVDNNPVGPPTEGAMVGDVKAGGAGAGYGSIGGDFVQPFNQGAGWTSPGRSWGGGSGWLTSACYGWGGAAGFNGNGGNAVFNDVTRPALNSGSGAGSAITCTNGFVYEEGDVTGAAGGVIIEYDHPAAPSPSTTPTPSVTPSITPSRSPTPSRTPSVSPTPSMQPFSQLITLVSPISGKQLTPQEDGSVASLWVGISYKEKWTVARLASGKYTFKGFNGRYLGANPGGWVRAEATSVGAWEEWDVLINPGSQWTLKSVHGTYMGTTAAGVIYLNDNAALYWTKSVA